MQIQFYPRSGHPREQFQVGGIKFLSRFENRITGKFRASVVCLFIYLFFFLLRDQSNAAGRRVEGEEILD